MSVEYCYGFQDSDVEIMSGVQTTPAVFWFHQCYDPEPVIFTVTVEYLLHIINGSKTRDSKKVEDGGYVYTYKLIPLSSCFEDKYISWYRP